MIEGGYLLRIITRLYAAPERDIVPPAHRFPNLFASGLLALLLVAGAILIDPLWQGLNTLAASATDTQAYVQTVLGGQGITR